MGVAAGIVRRTVPAAIGAALLNRRSAKAVLTSASLVVMKSNILERRGNYGSGAVVQLFCYLHPATGTGLSRQ
jgi:hypothetical protein